MLGRLICLVLVLTISCGPLAAAEATLKVGLLLSGSATDGGWNQLAKEAADTLKTQFKASVSFLQKVTPDKAGDEMRAYAADGYDLVICHGYEFLNPAAEVAKAPGTTRYVVCGADTPRDHLATLDFDLSQASYQIGMLAASLSHHHKLGFIGGDRIPSVLACYRGFCAGARSVTPDISVVETYTSWDQAEKSKSQAEALIEQGVDGIYHDVDAASRGIFEAVHEHNTPSAVAHDQVTLVYGSVADQNGNAICKDWMPASAVIHLDKSFQSILRSIQQGTFKPGVIRENLATGVCTLVLNPAMVANDGISAQLQALLNDAGSKLASGSLAIPAK